MKFSTLQDSKRIIYVGFQGQRIALEYNAKGYDGSMFKLGVNLAKKDDDDPARLSINNNIILRTVTAWDLTEEECSEECERRKEEMDDPICRVHSIPVTAETIAELPHLFRNNMASRIIEDATSDGSDPKLNGRS